MITLRPYQHDAIESIFQYFGTKSGNPIVAMPTGTGKSVVIAGFCMKVAQLYGNQRIVIATHVKELISQITRSFFISGRQPLLGSSPQV